MKTFQTSMRSCEFFAPNIILEFESVNSGNFWFRFSLFSCKAHISRCSSTPPCWELQVPYVPYLVSTPTRSMQVNGHFVNSYLSATSPFAFWASPMWFSSFVSISAWESRTTPSSLDPMSLPASWASGSGCSLDIRLDLNSVDWRNV